MYDFFVRPSRPHSCRKRRLCQGQARPGRSACLDIRRLASGQKILRAMDGNTSGGGSRQKYPKQKKDTGARPRFVPASLCDAPRFSPFSDRGGEHFSTAPCSVSDRRPGQFATDVFPVCNRRGFRFAPAPSPFGVSMRYMKSWPRSAYVLNRKAPAPSSLWARSRSRHPRWIAPSAWASCANG